MRLPSTLFKSLKTLPFLILIGLGFGCDEDTESEDVSLDPDRAGTPLESVSKNFVEDKIGISNDGSRIVFVSGKDSPAEGPFQFKAFYSDWGDTPGDPVRLTASESEELDVVLAGGGTRALLKVVSSGQTDLYIVTPGDTATLAQVTADSIREKSLAISDDAVFGAYVSPQSDGSGQVVVVNFGDGTAASFTSSTLSGGNYTEVYFVPGSSYQLVLVERDLISYAATVSTLSFTAIGDLADSGRQSVASEISYQNESMEVTAANLFWVSRATDRAQIAATGNFAYPDGNVTDVATKQTYVSIADLAGSATNRFKTDFGFRIEDLAFNQAGDFGYTSVNFINRCHNAEVATYGLALVRREISAASFFVEGDASADATAALAGIQDLAGTKSFAVSYCPPIPEESAGDEAETEPAPIPSFDNRIEKIAINGAATATDYKMAYLTRQANVYRSNCSHKIGDTEIRLVSVAAGTATFASLLATENRAPLVDEAPAGTTCP